MEMWTAPRICDCYCDLPSLPATLKEVLAARREVIARLEEGDTPPIFDGRWTWEVLKMAGEE
jgi:hypothetical protein